MQGKEASGFDAKRIARNTGYLYFRLAVVTVADLIAVKAVLNALGVTGYGVFSAVTGVVTSLLFLNGTLRGTAQRFLSFEAGKVKKGDVAGAFAAVSGLTVVLCVLIVLIGETAGIWFLKTWVKFPVDARPSALAIFHLGIVGMVLRTLQVPFDSLIVATERMDFFAKISVIEALTTLGASYAVMLAPSAKTEYYAVFLLIDAALILAIFAWYCRRRFPSVRFSLRFRLVHILEQGGFFSWSILGAIANVLKYQGVSMLVSVYAGTLFTATWSMAMKIGFNLYGIVGNFQQAFFPQVVKLWAHANKRPFYILTAGTLRWSFLLMGICVAPLLFATRPVLDFWIGGELPPQAVAFTRCVAVHFLFDALTGPLSTAIVATGRIAHYQIGLSLVMGSGFVVAWIALSLGLPPWTSVGSVAATNALALVYRFAYMRRHMGLHVIPFLRCAFGMSH